MSATLPLVRDTNPLLGLSWTLVHLLADDSPHAQRMGERIHEALDKLTPRERMVFELKHYQGLKLRTIGEMLNTTEETAKNTLFRATRKLRANLTELRGS